MKMLASFSPLPKTIAPKRHALLTATLLAILAGTLGQAVPAAAADTDRCQQLYSAWQRYKGVSTNGSGRDIQSQAALQDCRNGHVDAGVAQLEKLLKDDRIPVPDVSSAAR
jgi:hypothetical protein